jgi:probable DNA repair protein
LFELASAAPLTRAPVVGAGLELLDSMIDEDDAAYRVGRLLHSHFIRGAEIEASQRARLDVWRRGRSGRVPTVRRLQAAAASHGCPDLALALAAGVEKMEKWPKKDSATNWANEFFSLLSVLGWPGEQLASEEMQALQRWQDLLAEFGASDEIVGMLPAGEALGLLRNMTARALFEPEQPRGPLLVIDPETCAGMHFDGLWLCGLESGRWPPPARPDPFLPFAWQVRQQVPGSTPDLCLKEAERLLQSLASSAAEVIASVPAQNADAPLQPSPLVADWPAEAFHSLWQPLSVAAASFASRPELEHLDDPAMPAIRLAGAVNGGARALELQAGCGFRAQAELRLGARAIEEMTPGLDAGTRGTLAHEVLEDLWRKLGDSVALARHSPESLGRLLAGVVAARLASHVDVADPIGRRMLEFEAGWLQEQIMRLLDADRGRAPFAVASLEESCLLRIGGLELRLRPDRIDRLEDGSLALIDYKTGGDAELRAWFDERPALPQLPLYVEAIGAASVSAVAFGKLRAGQTGYLGLARSAGLFAGLQTFTDTRLAKGIDTWEEMLTTWRRRLELLAREHRGGDARLAANPQKACTYCGLSMLCRKNDTTPWPGRTDDP